MSNSSIHQVERSVALRYCKNNADALKLRVPGSPVTAKADLSPDLPTGLLSPLEEIKERLRGAVWMMDENTLPADQMRVYTDYSIEAIAVACPAAGKSVERN